MAERDGPRGAGPVAPAQELVSSKCPPCPWREAEALGSSPRLRAPRRGHVGVVGPRHRAGREQEETAAHAGGAHAGESPRRPRGGGDPDPGLRTSLDADWGSRRAARGAVERMGCGRSTGRPGRRTAVWRRGHGVPGERSRRERRGSA